MWVLLFKFFAIAVATMTIFYLAALVLRSVRRLNQRIAEFKAEQEALQNKPGPINPYAALAEIYEPPDPPKRSASLRRGRIVRNDPDDNIG